MSEINGHRFLRLLKQVSLDGELDECLLVIQDGKATIEASDLTVNVYIHCQTDLDLKDCELGLGNLSVLTKYLTGFADSQIDCIIKESESRLFLKPKKHGKLKYLLTEPDSISTRILEDDMLGQLLEPYKYKFVLTDKIATDLIKYVSLVDSPAITIKVNKKGKVYIKGGLESAHQFDIPVGNLLSRKKSKPVRTDPFEVSILSKFIVSVVKQLDFSEKEPVVLVGEEESVTIFQDKNNVYSFKPTSLDEED